MMKRGLVMAIRVLVAVLVMVCAPRFAALAHADSDGYYCVGPNYLAYQFGFAAPSSKPHHLFVVWLGEPKVIGQSAPFELPPFQVHGLVCEKERILVAAFDRLYTITLDHRGQPQTYSETLYEKPGAFLLDVATRQLNLGGWSRPVNSLQRERVPLPGPAGNEVVLEISPRPGVERCVTLITTRVIASDSTGQVGELTIFQGRGYRACGELDPGR